MGGWTYYQLVKQSVGVIRWRNKFISENPNQHGGVSQGDGDSMSPDRSYVFGRKFPGHLDLRTTPSVPPPNNPTTPSHAHHTYPRRAETPS